MWSRRDFLHCGAAAPVGLAWAIPAFGDDKAEAKKPDPLLTPAAQKAVASGLKYLQGQQHRDGSFGTSGFRGNVGITGLCGLAMLSAGHKPGAVGAFGQALDNAIDFVLAQEDQKTRGFLHNPKGTPHGPMYGHGFAVQFLAAAHDKVADRRRAGKLDE